MIGLKGEAEVIRESEDLTYIERRERLPEWLKLGGNKNRKVNFEVSPVRQANRNLILDALDGQGFIKKFWKLKYGRVRD